MKNKKGLISILTLIISVIACCFVFANNSTLSVVAAETPQNCYLLIDEEGNPYQSNVAAGKVEGVGKFVVGASNVKLTATANVNYKLVGWHITYLEQENKPQYVDATLITGNKVSFEMTAKDEETKTNATIELFQKDNVYQSSTFTIESVFENLSITPIFDHVYYFVDMTELVQISTLENQISIEDNIIFYEEVTINEGVSIYSNAYVKMDEGYYYYGSIHEENGKYYTVHKRLTDDDVYQRVDYKQGAFRVGDEVSFDFDVNIEKDIKSSKNIDLVATNIVGDSTINLIKNENTEKVENSFKISKDILSRTINYEMNFNVIPNKNQRNVVDIMYHNLYVVDLNILVDGDSNHNEHSDIISNISVNNFFVKINELQYLAKNSQDNGAKTFGIICSQKISKTIDNENYNYYNFKSLDAKTSTTQYYANINQNLIINIEYDSSRYEINFVCAEYNKDSKDNVTLSEISKNVLETISLTRFSDPVELSVQSLAGVENVGYDFVGFANSLDSDVSKTMVYSINSEKPKGTTIYLCFEKINYTVEFANYNQISIDEIKPINSINFTSSNGANVYSETLQNADLINEKIIIANKMQLNGNLTILEIVNDGFVVLGYSTKSPEDVTSEDYSENRQFNWTEDFIVENSQYRFCEYVYDVDLWEECWDRLYVYDAEHGEYVKNYSNTYNSNETYFTKESYMTIYVYEDFKSFTLTYYIQPETDNNFTDKVLMANIDVECDVTSIQKYDVNNQLISEENNNLTAMVAKIVVSNLKFNDQVVLTSSPLTVGDGEEQYSYVFNWFTVDGKSTLKYYNDNGVYKHNEKILQSREILVVYSMPKTKVFVAIEEEFATNENFEFAFTLESNGQQINPDEGTENIFTFEVGVKIKITISDVAYGYILNGCKYVELDESLEVNSMSVEHTTNVGINTLLFDFDRILYHFIFSQFGGGFDGDKILFNGKDYAVLDIDNTDLSIEKPLGYYVSSVRINETNKDYSEKLSENNEYRKNADIKTYNFHIEREDFENIVENLGVENDQTNIIEVNVQLVYSIFTYVVQVNYGLTNPKGEDNYFKPAIELQYNYDNGMHIASIDYSLGENTIAFINIPYNAIATMTLLDEATPGFSLSGWYDEDGNRISQDDYAHSLQSLFINNLIGDKVFVYKLTYNTYQLSVVYNSEQGNPLTYINDKSISGESKQIMIYDSFSIISNAFRNKGYVYDSISYNKPVYTKYVYSEESWNSDYDKLYVLKNEIHQIYQLNTSSEYDESQSYYKYTQETVIIKDMSFSESSFLVTNYAIEKSEDGEKVVFTVNYKLLEMTIKNQINENPVQYYENGWTLTGRGSEAARVQFVLQDMARFEIVAMGSDGKEREIKNNETVTYYDNVTVRVFINKNAVNIDGVEYDLSLGLTLNKVDISGKSFYQIKSHGNGEYSFTFYVGEYMPTDEIVKIDYELYIATKTVNVTTIVKDSTSFYQNIQLNIDAKVYEFGKKSFSLNGASSISQNLQFLAKANVFSKFSTENYRNNFDIAGVKIYCDGSLISPSDYVDNGIELTDDENVVIDVRLLKNVDVVFIVQPKINYNGGPVYSKTFLCDEFGNGISQKLSIGSSSDNDIQVDEMLKNSILIEYISTEPNSTKIDEVTKVGRYNVQISFVNTDSFDWLEEITVAEDVVLVIQAKELYITYDTENIQAVQQAYNGTSDYNVMNVYKYLVFTDNNNLNIKYIDIINSQNNNLALDSASCYISSAGKDSAIASANENVYYNLYIYNFVLKNNEFNKNFVLRNNDLVIYAYIQITKREIRLQNVFVANKVYDGTVDAELIDPEGITLSDNKIAGDDVSLNISKLNPYFENAEVGANKKVVIDVTNALVGKDISNYYISDIQKRDVIIYPYMLSTNINGLGTISVINKRGLTEKDKVDLIPLNATLNVHPIYADSNQYVSIYGKINKYLRGNKEFAIGYEISFVINGENIPVNNNLYLSVPKVKNVISGYYLTGQKTGSISHSMEDGNFLIDLSQINEDVNVIFFAKTKFLLKAWQIVLIVIGAVLLVATAVLVFIIIRKRKIDRDSVHEKI